LHCHPKQKERKGRLICNERTARSYFGLSIFLSMVFWFDLLEKKKKGNFFLLLQFPKKKSSPSYDHTVAAGTVGELFLRI